MTALSSENPVANDSTTPLPALDSTADASGCDAPFIIGVSGHRDLDPRDGARLSAAVREFLQQIRACLPDTEIRVMAGMASGADLLAARAALELGLRVDAVLPLPLQHYAADFETAPLRELEALLAHPSVRCTELSLTPDAGGADIEDADPRNAHYLNLTRTLVARSHLLLAIWDGETSIRPGGTADTLLRYLGLRSDRRPEDSPILVSDAPPEQEPDSRLAYWIPTARGGGGASDGPAAPCYLSGLGEDVLQRWTSMPEPLREQLTALNTYNREFHGLARHRKARAAPDSLMRSLPDDVPVPPAARGWLGRIDAQYGKADALALHFQARSDLLFVFFTMTTLLMGLAYLAYDKFAENRVLLFVYLLVLLSGFGLYLLLNGRHWFGKHLMYRALAETLRAKFYLCVAGADHLVDADEVMSLSRVNRFHGFGWIAHVLTGLGRPADGATADAHAHCLDGVESAWIESQRRYFAGKVERLERSGRRTRWLKRFLFVIILLAIASLILLGHSADRIRPAFGIPLQNTLTFVLGLPALVLGVWELHQNKMATRELLWQYRHQLDHFSRARAQLAKTSTVTRRRQVLARLGRDSLMESYLWTIHRYHREHEPGRG